LRRNFINAIDIIYFGVYTYIVSQLEKDRLAVFTTGRTGVEAPVQTNGKTMRKSWFLPVGGFYAPGLLPAQTQKGTVYKNNGKGAAPCRINLSNPAYSRDV
jgi:hypothetical protein